MTSNNIDLIIQIVTADINKYKNNAINFNYDVLKQELRFNFIDDYEKYKCTFDEFNIIAKKLKEILEL